MTIHKNNNELGIIIVAPLGAPERRVRLVKTFEILHDRYDVRIGFWGWKRTSDESLGADISYLIENRELLSGGGYRSSLTRLLYIVWMVKVFVALLKRAPRSVYCLGLETAFPAWLASRFRREIRYIFDDADRMVMLWSLPSVIERIIVFVERRVSRDSVAHIVPSRVRYDYSNSTMVEIFNMPNRDQIEKAKQLVELNCDDKFRVYVNGWLDETRGLRMIEEAAQLLERSGDSDILFNVAPARLTNDASRLFKMSNVNNLGRLIYVESLAQYPSNDVVLTFYDPAVRVNRYALSNKWGDAISMCTPIIVNEGIVTAAPLLDVGAAIECPFGDGVALAQLLRDLRDDRSRLDKVRATICQLQREYTTFDEAMSKVLAVLLGLKPSCL